MPAPRRHEDAAARQRAYRERRKLARRAEPCPKDLPPPSALHTMPSAVRWKALRHEAEASLLTLLNEMQTYRDQRSDSWQEGKRGEAFEEALERVEEAIQAIQDIE